MIIGIVFAVIILFFVFIGVMDARGRRVPKEGKYRIEVVRFASGVTKYRLMGWWEGSDYGGAGYCAISGCYDSLEEVKELMAEHQRRDFSKKVLSTDYI